MTDATEEPRRRMQAELNREGVPPDYDGQIWDTDQLQEDFKVESFAAPFVIVRRKSDDVRGSLKFVHQPRLYFDFTPV